MYCCKNTPYFQTLCSCQGANMNLHPLLHTGDLPCYLRSAATLLLPCTREPIRTNQQTHTDTHTQTHTHTHTHTQLTSYTYEHTFSLSHTLTLSHTLYLSLSLSLSLSLTHTHSPLT